MLLKQPHRTRTTGLPDLVMLETLYATGLRASEWAEIYTNVDTSAISMRHTNGITPGHERRLPCGASNPPTDTEAAYTRGDTASHIAWPV